MTGAQEPQRGPTFPLPIGGRPFPLPRNTLSEHLADYADPHRVRDLVPASRSGEGAPEALEADKPGDIYFDAATSELYVMREVAGVPSWLPVGSSETTAAAEAAKESADAAKASVDALVAESAGFARTSDLDGVAKTADLSPLAKASAVVEVGEKVGQICTVLGGDTDGDTVQAIVKKIHECAGERDSGSDGYGMTIHELLDELYRTRLGGQSPEWYEIHEAVSYLRGFRASDNDGNYDDDITWLMLVQRVKETLEKVDALTTKIDSANAELETTA